MSRFSGRRVVAARSLKAIDFAIAAALASPNLVLGIVERPIKGEVSEEELRKRYKIMRSLLRLDSEADGAIRSSSLNGAVSFEVIAEYLSDRCGVEIIEMEEADYPRSTRPAETLIEAITDSGQLRFRFRSSRDYVEVLKINKWERVREISIEDGLVYFRSGRKSTITEFVESEIVRYRGRFSQYRLLAVGEPLHTPWYISSRCSSCCSKMNLTRKRSIGPVIYGTSNCRFEAYAAKNDPDLRPFGLITDFARIGWIDDETAQPFAGTLGSLAAFASHPSVGFRRRLGRAREVLSSFRSSVRHEGGWHEMYPDAREEIENLHEALLATWDLCYIDTWNSQRWKANKVGTVNGSAPQICTRTLSKITQRWGTKTQRALRGGVDYNDVSDFVSELLYIASRVIVDFWLDVDVAIRANPVALFMAKECIDLEYARNRANWRFRSLCTICRCQI